MTTQIAGHHSEPDHRDCEGVTYAYLRFGASPHAAELWVSLQPAAFVNDLELVRAAVAPLEVPSELIEVLSWRNGGSPDARADTNAVSTSDSRPTPFVAKTAPRCLHALS